MQKGRGSLKPLLRRLGCPGLDPGQSPCLFRQTQEQHPPHVKDTEVRRDSAAPPGAQVLLITPPPQLVSVTHNPSRVTRQPLAEYVQHAQHCARCQEKVASCLLSRRLELSQF